MPEQETQPSESPAAASANSPKHRYRKWTREEEQELVNILSANLRWRDSLFPSRKNRGSAYYSKSGLAKQIATLIRPDDPPTAAVVLQKINGMERRYWDWRDRKSQAGSIDGVPLAKPGIQAEEEPWFEQFAKLCDEEKATQSPEVGPDAAPKEGSAKPTQSCPEPQQQCSQGVSERLDPTAPLAKKRKTSDSFSSNSPLEVTCLAAFAQPLRDISDSSLKALQLRHETEMASIRSRHEEELVSLREHHADMQRMFKTMDDMSADWDEHLRISTRDLLLQHLQEKIESTFGLSCSR